MSVNETRSLLDRLVARRDSLWKLLVDSSISDALATKVETELRSLESRIFSIQCKLVKA